jgi:hypothetical protein
MNEKIRNAVQTAQASMEDIKRLGIEKPEPLNRFVRRLAQQAGIYPLPNLAVDICVEAYTKLMQEDCNKNLSTQSLALKSRISYCALLPRLSDSDSVRDFIACVVHGMAIGAIPSTEGTRLLYGAQVAIGALPSPKRHKKRNKSAQNVPGNHLATPTPSVI